MAFGFHEPAHAAQSCIGDCNGDVRVTAAEIVTLITEHNAVSTCSAGDADNDGRISDDEIAHAITNVFGGCALEAGSRTLDDLFEEVARLAPEFGGMFLSEDQQTLQVFSLDTTAATVDEITNAIHTVFGPIIPAGGVHALPGQYGFIQLRQWYRAMVGTVLSTPGVVATDINEAINRLAINIETPEVEEQVVQTMRDLEIPLEAVSIVVLGPVQEFQTLQDVQSPRRGGFQITRLANNTAGYGIVASTLGFNAIRGGVPGLVTCSHSTQVFWNLDTNGGYPPADFYQSPGYYPAQWVGTESVDTQGFVCPPPYSSSQRCRYSDSAFVKYNTGVTWDPGAIGKTIAPTVLTTTIANLVLTVDQTTKFRVVSPPTQPYLSGLVLHKVGRTTGWTSGAIIMTCADFGNATTMRLCQYMAYDPQLAVATFGDSGSPVFRMVDPQCGYVELYGILWGGGIFFIPPPPWSLGSVAKAFVFSPIGGVPFQASGVQSVQDLGALNYSTAPGKCVTPTPTVAQPCSFVGLRMCGGTCPNATDVCVPLPDDSACVCQSGQPSPTATPTPTRTATRTATGTPAPPTHPPTPTSCTGGPIVNLVVNPGFETFSAIPTGLGQINLATSWTSPTNASPDYFHSLASPSSSVSVPSNAFGSEAAHGGRAYVGVHTRPINAYREYVEGVLSSPLAAGSTYQVSFYLSLSDGSRWAVDKFGAYLSVGSVGPASTAYVLPLAPQINATGYVTTKIGWVQVVGSYTAAGSEDHLVIGNFFDNPSTNPLMGQGGSYDFAYYYIDDVAVTLLTPSCTPTPSASVTRTATVSPTLRPVPTCDAGIVCTPTPSRSPTATQTCPGAKCTVTPTRTATKTPKVPPD
ncbi:MAG TPA: hypothetical protein VMW17_06400 [Candidatus Binatia bacterium]|nr:hypothetical protein [Candidatus Binatia bacterium]